MFETKDVYELIDGVLVDGIMYEQESYSCDTSYQCIHCFSNVNEYQNGKKITASKAKSLIKHFKNCPYTLALSMNSRRDYKKYPEKVIG